ncbi:DUF4102 domain-containing protein [Belnapia moabensis]|uniref:DUF4102 domain-containing protein n=1 Tax=Belnapia moabensis TaxID=365533 RepID=UPI001B80DBB2|nr:DUF4102 domain-containing protein [Belnapia moabensis]
MLAGKAREMGLGAFDVDVKAGVTLAQARVKAEEVRAVLQQGLDRLRSGRPRPKPSGRPR